MPSNNLIRNASLVLLVMPGLFGLDALAGTKNKVSMSSPVVKISGAVNAAVRYVDVGYPYGVDSNSLVGQARSDFELSHVRATVSHTAGDLDFSGIFQIATNFNSFQSMDENNFRFTPGNQSSLASVDYQTFESNVLDYHVNHKYLGGLKLGYAPTVTKLSTEASFAKTGYHRGDITNFARTHTIAADLTRNNMMPLEWIFGTYLANGNNARLEYSTPNLNALPGLKFTASYVSKSDSINSSSMQTLPTRHDSMGYAVNYITNLNGVDLDLRAGYTSRGLSSGYKALRACEADTGCTAFTNNTLVNGGAMHLRNLGVSGAMEYQGFDASFAYAKITPKDFVNGSVYNAQITQPVGSKPAELMAFELGRSQHLDALNGPLSVSVEYAVSRKHFSDDVKSSLVGFRVAHDRGDVKFYGLYQNFSFSNLSTWVNDDALNVVYGKAKNINGVVLGAYYTF
jgi:hypothetical protein